MDSASERVRHTERSRTVLEQIGTRLHCAPSQILKNTSRKTKYWTNTELNYKTQPRKCIIEYTNIHIPKELHVTCCLPFSLTVFFLVRIIYYLPFVYKRLDIVLMCENVFFKSKFLYFIFNEYFHVWDMSGSKYMNRQLV